MQEYIVPYVEKKDVSLIVIGFVGLEPHALRSTLEWYGYRVDTHWVGSKAELHKILSGEIPTKETLILSCHGLDEGILIEGETPLTAEEIKINSNLKGKTIISMGCLTGRDKFAQAVIDSGASTYIAPRKEIDGNACLMFVNHLFYYMVSGDDLHLSYKKAYSFDQESKLFSLYSYKSK